MKKNSLTSGAPHYTLPPAAEPYQPGDLVVARRTVVEHGVPAYIVGRTGVVQPRPESLVRSHRGTPLYYVKFDISRHGGSPHWFVRAFDLDPVRLVTV